MSSLQGRITEIVAAWLGQLIRDRVSPRAKRLGEKLRRAIVAPFAWTWGSRAEILTTLAFVGGWLMITWGLAELVTVWIWPISLGALLLSAGGWGLLFEVVRDGLYTLTRPTRGKR